MGRIRTEKCQNVLKTLSGNTATVKTKRIQQALQIMKEAFQEAGKPIADVALEFAVRIAQDPRVQELLTRPEQIASASVVAGCLQEAKKFETLPDQQWEQFVENLRQELPYSLRAGFRAGMNEIVK